MKNKLSAFSPHRMSLNFGRSLLTPFPSATRISKSFSSLKSKTKSLTVKDLPKDTLYILDGTSMLFQSYHSREHLLQFENCWVDDGMASQLIQQNMIDMQTYNKEVDEMRAKKQSHGDTWTFHSLANKGPRSERIPKQANNDHVLNLYCGALSILALKIARFVRDVRPQYLAVAFDTGKGTFRSDMYSEYKAHRKSVPVMLSSLFGLAPKVFEAMGVQCFGLPGYEADDVMASLGGWALSGGLHVVHVSDDKDMLQLVQERVHVLKGTRTTKLTGSVEVEKLFGIHSDVLVDYLTLVGDAADGVPGVKGVGPKFALALLRSYGSIEGIIEHLNLPNEPLLSSVGAETAVSLAPQESVAKLQFSLGDLAIKGKAEKIIVKLLHAGADRLRLFKNLICLKENLSPEEMHFNPNGHLSFDHLQYRGPLPGAKDILHGISPSLIHGLDLLNEVSQNTEKMNEIY